MHSSTDYHYQTALRNNQKMDHLYQALPSYVCSYLNAKASNCRASTRLAYAGDLVIFFTFLSEKNPILKGKKTNEVPLDLLGSLTFEDINEYQAYLDHGIRADGHAFTNSQSTKARRMSSLRSFFRYESTHGYLKNDPTAGAERIRLKKDKMINRLNNDEVCQLMDVTEHSRLKTNREIKLSQRTQLRDTAILTLLLYTGIRISECVGLDLNDIDFDSQSMIVIRKGGKPDTVYFNDTVAGALKDYIDLERPSYLGTEKEEQALFLSNRRQRMGVRSIQEMLKKYAETAIPQHVKVTPHVLRKTYGTALYDETSDIRLVADVLGHNSVDTTAKHYIDMSTEHKKKAAGITPYERTPVPPNREQR